MDFRNISIFFICVFAPGSRGGVLCSLDAADFRLVRWARYERHAGQLEGEVWNSTPIAMVGMLTEFLGSFALLDWVSNAALRLGFGHFHGGGDLEGSLGIRFLFGAPPGRRQRHRVLFGAFSHGCGSAHRRGGALSIDGLLSQLARSERPSFSPDLPVSLREAPDRLSVREISTVSDGKKRSPTACRNAMLGESVEAGPG